MRQNQVALGFLCEKRTLSKNILSFDSFFAFKKECFLSPSSHTLSRKMIPLVMICHSKGKRICTARCKTRSLHCSWTGDWLEQGIPLFYPCFKKQKQGKNHSFVFLVHSVTFEHFNFLHIQTEIVYSQSHIGRAGHGASST